MSAPRPAIRPSFCAGLVLGLALAALATLPVVARAQVDALEGRLEVESAFVTIIGGVYQLHARIRYPANADTQAALRDGVSLSYNLEVEIERERRWWPDASVTAIALRRTLTYHAVSQRYLVRELGRRHAAGATNLDIAEEARGADEAGQVAFETLDEALAYVGRVDGWPILVAPQVRPRAEYRVSVRASVRRGRLPDALRTLMFWTDDWSRESDWYSWSLPR